MTEPERPRPPRPLLELLVLFGLPLVAIVASLLLVHTARQQGFTAVEGTVVAPKGH